MRLVKQNRFGASCMLTPSWFYVWLFYVLTFCIRQHDVNILMHRSWEECTMFVCSVFSYLLCSSFLVVPSISWRTQILISKVVFKPLLCLVRIFLVSFFCIRQHDVNILTQKFLEKRRDVCVLRFFSLSCSCYCSKLELVD